MPALPVTTSTLLVRTDFSDDAAWSRARDTALSESAEGFRAYVEVVDDPGWSGWHWRDLRDAAVAVVEHSPVLLVLDSFALGDEHAVLVVDLTEPGAPPFRCVATELWGVDNNLTLANMDWQEFAESVDDDGVFRGFPE